VLIDLAVTLEVHIVDSPSEMVVDADQSDWVFEDGSGVSPL
jgi:hypothetical protein